MSGLFIYIGSVIDNDLENLNVVRIMIYGMCFSTIAAITDIAADGWGLSIFSEKNV